MCRKVAIYRSDLLPISETFIRDQASALTDWQPTLIGRREVPEGLATPKVERVIIPEAGSRPMRTLRYWTWQPDPNLVRYLRGQNFSLVHAHFGIDATDIWPSVRAAGLPLLVTLHGADINIHRWWWEQGHGGLRRRVYPRRLLKMAQAPSVRFIAVSNAIKQRAIEYGIPADKITVCYIGVDTERFKPGGLPLAQRKKRILFVGRMVEKKAPLLMVRAYAEVRKQVPDAELVMIGTGPLLEDAKRLAQELDVPVEFLGARSSDEVLAQLHQARVFCLPSITAENGDAEGLPISILEAQACGVPVITSARGGNEGIIKSGTGEFFPENDFDSAAALLKEYLGNTKDNINNKARDFCSSNHNIRRNTTLIQSIYTKIT